MPVITQAATGGDTYAAANANLRQTLTDNPGVTVTSDALRIEGMPRVMVYMAQTTNVLASGYQVQFSASAITGGLVPVDEWLSVQAPTPMPVVPLGTPVTLFYNGLVARLLRVVFYTNPLAVGTTTFQILLGAAQ